jgi:L-lysine 2,3-aminomutase (EC 5.4.3.2)
MRRNWTPRRSPPAPPCAKAGALLLNQSVLLAGVNDSADALYALSERLCAAGVVPYYLHLMDPVRGAAHFDVPVDRAGVILRELSDRAPGYFVPRLVREEPGAPAKRWIPW